MADLKKLQSLQLKKLSVRQCTPESKLQFTVEAWRQKGLEMDICIWIQFFEYLQGQAEVGLERLHHCAEELKHFVYKTQDPSNNFDEFQRKLTGLTEVTKTYFENLVKALENGLADVKHSERKSKTKSKPATKRRKLVK